MSDYASRLVTEHIELVERIERLDKFINGTGVPTAFHYLPEVDKDLLRVQLGLMRSLATVLLARRKRNMGHA